MVDQEILEDIAYYFETNLISKDFQQSDVHNGPPVSRFGIIVYTTDPQ